MKPNAFLVLGVFFIGETASAESREHKWNFTVERAAAFCSFENKIPVKLEYRPDTNRFEIVSEGSLEITAQGMEEIYYVSDGYFYGSDGSPVLEESAYDGSAYIDVGKITLEGPEGNIPLLYSSGGEKSGVKFQLPTSEAYTYKLEVSDTYVSAYPLTSDDDYIMRPGDELTIVYEAWCLEAAPTG